MRKLTDAQSRQISQLKEEMKENCASLEEELLTYKDHMTQLSRKCVYSKTFKMNQSPLCV